MHHTSPPEVRGRRPRRHRLIAGAAIAAVLGMISTPVVQADVGTGANGDPFPRGSSIIFVEQGSPSGNPVRTTLYSAVQTMGGSVTFEPEGSPVSTLYNAMGFHPSDMYLYALKVDSNVLLRIGQHGAVTNLGTVQGLPGGANYAFNAADFGQGAYSDILFVRNGSNEFGLKSLWAIDVTTGIATTIQLSQNVPNTGDLVFKDGFLWAIDGENGSYPRVFRIDPATGNTTLFSLGNLGLISQAYGAQWLYGNGNIGISGNKTGQIYQLSITDPASANPTFAVVSTMRGTPTTQNDGASYLGEPVDLGIVKETAGLFVPGSDITYTFTITNHSEIDSSGFVVSDTLPAGLTNPTTSDEGCTVDASTGSAVLTCVGDILPADDPNTTAQENVRVIEVTATTDAGITACLDNSASILGNEEDPNDANDTSSAQTCPSLPAIELVKDVDNAELNTGDPLTYTFTVTNSGNVPLTDVTVNDPMFGGVVADCSAATLAVGASVQCTATHTVTADEVTAGKVINTATASGTPPIGDSVSDEDTATVPVEQVPELSLVKSADSQALVAGSELTYTFTVTNTGNVPLTDVTVNDPMFGGVVADCSVATLAVGENLQCTATHTVTQAEVDAGQLTNVATAVGTPPTGDQVSDTDTVEIVQPESPSLTVDKTVNADSLTVGDTLTYSFTVTNTGNVTLSNITLDDPMFGGAIDGCTTAALAPGGAVQCSATYVVTQADVDAGSLENVATGSGTSPAGSSLSDSDDVVIVEPSNPMIDLVKTVDGDELAVGDTLTYTLIVTNTGNVTLTEVSVDDPLVGGVIDGCSVATLAPGDSVTCTAPYLVTAADVEAGTLTNTATASGLPPLGEQVTGTASVTVPAVVPVPLTTTPTTTTPVVQGSSSSVTPVLARTGTEVLPVACLGAAFLATGMLLIRGRRRLTR